MNLIKILIILAVSICYISGNDKFKHYAPGQFTLDSGYFKDNYEITNRTTTEYQENFLFVEKAIFLGGNSLFSDSALGRSGNLFFNFLLLGPFELIGFNMHSAPKLVGHEYAHLHRSAAYGVYQSFNPDHGTSIFSFTLNSLDTKFEAGGYTWRGGKQVFLFNTPEITFDEVLYRKSEQLDFRISAAGLNWESNIRENLMKNNSLSAQGSLSHILNYYYWSKGFRDYTLTTGDRYEMNQYYSKIGVSDSQVADAEEKAFLYSASTWFYAYTLANYMVTGNHVVPSTYVYGIRLPDISTYHNLEGVSHKIQTGIMLNDSTIIPISYEYVVDGIKRKEFELGLNYQFDNFGIMTNLWISEGTKDSRIIDYSSRAKQDDFYYQYELGLSYTFNEYLNLNLGWKHYNVNTLDGGRNIPSLRNGEEDDEFWLNIKVSLDS